MGQPTPTVKNSPTLGVVAELLGALVIRKGDGPADGVLTSRTLWVMVLALVAMVLQALLDEWILAPQYQGIAVALLGIVLRVLTGTRVALRQEDDLDIPAAPRRVRKRIARNLAKSVTHGPKVLLASLLMASSLASCAGFEVHCDDPTLLLRDASRPDLTKLVVQCSGQDLLTQEVDLAELAGVDKVCPEPSLVLRGEDAKGDTIVELQCNGLVVATFRMPLGELLREMKGSPQPTVRPAVLLPAGTCEAPASGPGPAEVQ